MPVAFSLVCVVALAGCGHESVRGETTTFAYDWWLGPLLVLLGLACLPAGYQLAREGKRLAAGLLIVIGPGLTVVLAPGAFLNHVTVTPDHFEVRYGFWWARERHFVRFADLEDVRVVTHQQQGTRGKHVISNLHYTLRTGRTGIIPLNGDLRWEAAPLIVKTAREHGVGPAP